MVLMTVFLMKGGNWLGEKDSNPHNQIQNLMSYP